MKIISSNRSANLASIVQLLKKPWVPGFLCFGILTLMNAPYLHNPPYWDEMIGTNNQALWLKNHHFNLPLLWQTGNDSNVYPFSLNAILYAFLYSLFEPQTVHLIWHLLVMVSISISVALAYTIIFRFTKHKSVAFIWSIAVLFEPVMAGRTAELGHESLLGMFIMMVIYFTSTQRYWLALAGMFISFYIKPTGVLLFCSMTTFIVMLYGFNSHYFDFKKQRKFVIVFIITCLVTVCLYKITSDARGGDILTWGGYLNNLYQFYFLIPMSGILLLTVIVAGIIYVAKIAVRCIKTRKMPVIDSEIATLLFLLIFICGFWVAYIIFKISLPRYTVITVLPMFVFLGIVIKRRDVSILLAIVLTIAGYFCWNDRFLPALPDGLSRSGDLLERNREYLKDLDSNRTLCKLLEENYFNHTIVAKPPFLQMLTLPEFGYVKKTLPNVLSAVTNTPLYCPVKNLSLATVPPDALYIYSRNVCEYGADDYCLVPFRQDTIIYLEGTPPAVNVIYMKSPERRLMTLKELRHALK